MIAFNQINLLPNPRLNILLTFVPTEPPANKLPLSLSSAELTKSIWSSGTWVYVADPANGWILNFSAAAVYGISSGTISSQYYGKSLQVHR